MLLVKAMCCDGQKKNVLMDDKRIPKALFYGQLTECKRHLGANVYTTRIHLSQT